MRVWPCWTWPDYLAVQCLHSIFLLALVITTPVSLVLNQSIPGLPYKVDDSLAGMASESSLPRDSGYASSLRTYDAASSSCGQVFIGQSGGPSAYALISLVNNQSIATPTPFQQEVTVNSTCYASYEALNLQNIDFTYSNGTTILPSWLESGNSNTVTNTIYWLKLVNGIPSKSVLTLRMNFYSQSKIIMDGSNTGEKPTLSTPYGQYDNGASVFNFYDNFAGTQIDTNKWTVGLSNTNATYASVKVNNGVNITVTNGQPEWAGLVSRVGFRAPQDDFEASVSTFSGCFVYYTDCVSHGFGIGEGNASNLSSPTYFLSSFYDRSNPCGPNYNCPTFTYYGFQTGSVETGMGGPQFSTRLGIGINGITWLNSTAIAAKLGGCDPYCMINETQFFGAAPPSANTVYLVLGIPTIGLISGAGRSTGIVDWVSVRAFPPKGIMPSVAPVVIPIGGSGLVVIPNTVFAMPENGNTWSYSSPPICPQVMAACEITTVTIIPSSNFQLSNGQGFQGIISTAGYTSESCNSVSSTLLNAGCFDAYVASSVNAFVQGNLNIVAEWKQESIPCKLYHLYELIDLLHPGSPPAGVVDIAPSTPDGNFCKTTFTVPASDLTGTAFAVISIPSQTSASVIPGGLLGVSTFLILGTVAMLTRIFLTTKPRRRVILKGL